MIMQPRKREPRDELDNMETGEEQTVAGRTAANMAMTEPHHESKLEQAMEPNGVGEQMATAAVVGLGVAALEVELLPGLLLGVGAMLAPKVFPVLGSVVRPLAKTVIRLGYSLVSTTQSVVAEAGEQIQDMVAEVQAEQRAQQVSRRSPGQRDIEPPANPAAT